MKEARKAMAPVPSSFLFEGNSKTIQLVYSSASVLARWKTLKLNINTYVVLVVLVVLVDRL